MRPALNIVPGRPASRTPRLLRAVNEPIRSFAELVAEAQDEEKEGRRLTARHAFERAISAMRTPDDGKKASSVMRWIARTYQFDGDVDAALDCLEAAIAVAEAWEDHAAVGHAINVQAVVRWQQGDMDEAERLSLLARNRAIRAGDAKLAAMTAQNLGVLANIRGDYATAEVQYTASLAEYRALGLAADVCVALNNLGLLYTATGAWQDAERVLVEGAQIAELQGDTAARVQLDINLAELWVKRGEYVRAQGTVRKALAAAGQTGDASAIAKGTKLLGVIARETGAYDEAERHFLRADEVATARGELLLQAEVARDRADLARRMGRNKDVLQQLNRAHKLFTRLRAEVDVADIGERQGDLEQEFLHVARRWGESIEAKDRYTQGHCQRVAEMACAMARHGGFDEHALFWFRIGALLHDVGKLVIPPEVLNKPGRLDDDEWKLMRSHTTAGVEMLADIEFPWEVRPMVESHHERWDGKGYPHGLEGEAIPLIARILSIADVYDALTSVRSYKRAFSHEDACAMLREDVGTVFDPAVFAWFEAIAADWPEHIAHVMGEHTRAPGAAPADSPEPSADLDVLTRVPLRRAFRETGERLLEARRTTGRPISILVIDVDRFSAVNAAHGPSVGDAVLCTVADRIRVNTRPSDYIARYSADEFAVLLPGTRLEDAQIVADRIRESIANATFETASPLSISVSVGVACAPYHGETLDALFNAADSALYVAKQSGKNSVALAARINADRQQILPHGFVGRLAETERLREQFQRAAGGDPSLTIVFGEAGIGKSTLLRQLGPEIGINAGAILTSQCIEASIGLPYGPWADIILDAHRAGLVAPMHWTELTRIVPELRDETQAAVASDHEDRAQRVLLEELEEFLRLAASKRPLTIVIDDMQWADAASWGILEYLLARLRDQRIMLCITIRTEDLASAAEERLQRFSRWERCSEIRLTRLSAEEIATWLRGALGGQEVPHTLLEYVMRQSEGNALFAVQTLRALVEHGSLRPTDDGWQFEPKDAASLPPAIGDLLTRRVRRFTRGHRDILSLAAVLGREFHPELLVAACDAEEADVHDALDEAIAAGVLVSGHGTRATLTFTHALLTRALLHGLNPLRLRRMHERVARALAASHAPDVAALVMHLDLAGASGEAFQAATEAGGSSRSLFAYESALEFYRIALRHASTPIEYATVVWALAQTEEARGGFAAAESHCDDLLQAHLNGATSLRIVAQARRMRERLRLQRGVSAEQVFITCEELLAMADAAEDADESAALLIMLSAAQQRIGNIGAAERLARDAVDAAERTARPAVQADAVTRLGSVLLVANPANAVPLYRRALDAFSQLGDRAGQMRCHINVGSACDRAGNHPAAEASYLMALEIGRQIRASDLSGVASLNLGVLHFKTGKSSSARSRFEEALRVFTTIGHEPYRLASLYNLAHLARGEGDSATALELYDACIVLAATISQIDVHVGAMAGAGLAKLDLQTVAGAREHRDRARELVDGRDDWWFQGRELWEALQIRLLAHDEGHEPARARLLDVLPRAEASDQYAALWLGAECADVLRAGDDDARRIWERLQVQARALGYSPLVARLARS